MALPLYAATLFVSAFILFLVQPMIGKMILPKLGGTPQVWNTCMVFFQTILLAGYAYTHFVSTRLKLRQQLLVHGILILLPFLVLGVLREPFDLQGWTPDLGVNPIPSALYILLVIVGLPFFVVSTTAPLLQRWFSYSGHPAARDPYFLYGASNLGSMLALLCYPALIEPIFRLHEQTMIWTGGFVLLVVTVFACIAFVWKPATTPHVDEPGAAANPPPPADAPAGDKPVETGITAKPAPVTAVKAGAPKHAPVVSLAPPAEEVNMLRRLKWVALAAVPSSMMLGITTHITTDLSPVPLIWLIPLTLYLLSFILVFARWPVVWVDEPHKIMVYLQPLAIAVMLLSDFMHWGHSYLRIAIACNVAGFFFTTMVCHGELAKDRPSTRHLTEFYLMMSIGGMLGGMFNGLFAPNIPYLFEYPAAIIAACLLRPTLTEGGWLANFVAGLIDPSAGEAAAAGKKGKGHKPHAVRGHVTPNLVLTLDIVLAVAVGVLAFVLYQIFYDPRNPEAAAAFGFGVPLMISCAMLFRPLRYGLAIALIIFVNAYINARADTSDLRTRGYFGLIKVSTRMDERIGPFKQMIHGHINHGMNFLKPKNQEEWGDPKKDYSRHATTYYHRYGPAGVVMERFCWFKEEQNYFNSDSRIAASLVGQIMPLSGATLPADAIAAMWSEPPFATIGLGTGTMASYARPYQHCHYYEIDNLVKRLSLEKSWDVSERLRRNLPQLTYEEVGEKNLRAPHFTYLRDALSRGAHVQVLMGDARLRMALPYKSHYEDPEMGGGPMDFYHMMVVDAFSSDAIPAHLITKQAIAMYMDRLTEDGCLCVHTSNRFVDLVKVVADVASSLDETVLDYQGRPLQLVARRGHDNAPFKGNVGHFTSEWVMVYRKTVTGPDGKRIPNPWGTNLREPAGWRRAGGQGQYWETPPVYGRYVWTDDFYNILGVLR
ncbi:MAG: hypothetical protein L0Y71_02260 [Gemmataceae bacterium]|nr:hypothetical protein [Gemmataceae bacterium]